MIALTGYAALKGLKKAYSNSMEESAMDFYDVDVGADEELLLY